MGTGRSYSGLRSLTSEFRPIFEDHWEKGAFPIRIVIRDELTDGTTTSRILTKENRIPIISHCSWLLPIHGLRNLRLAEVSGLLESAAAATVGVASVGVGDRSRLIGERELNEMSIQDF